MRLTPKPKQILLFLLVTGLGASSNALTLRRGDLLVADAGSTAPAAPARVIRVHPTTGAQDVVSSGGLLVAPVAIAFEESGSILVADSGSSGDGAILRIDPADGSQTSLSGPYLGLLGLTIRPSDGTIYVTDEVDDAVYQVDSISGARTVVSSGSLLHFAQAITSAPDGFLYVADFFNSAWTVLQVEPTPPNGAQDPFAGGFQYVGGLAASPGALWVTDASGGAVTRVDLATSDPSTAASDGDLLFPFGIAVEESGDLVVTDWGSATVAAAVVRVEPITGSQTVVAPGGFLREPWGIAVVTAPESSGSLIAIVAIAALAALGGRASA